MTNYAAVAKRHRLVRSRGNANWGGCGSQRDNNHTAPVGLFAPNQFGPYDMLGNVWGVGRGLLARQL
jgi:formylglycine-generating enzyme required for sulfatase activity